MTIITDGQHPRPIGPLLHRSVWFTAEPKPKFGESFVKEEGTLRMPVRLLPKDLISFLDLPEDYVVVIRRRVS